MKDLATALVEAQKDMPVVHKTASANTGTFSYSYVTLDQLIEKTKPVLIKNGLAIAQFPTETSTGAPGLRTILMHNTSGESLEATVPLLLNGKHDMQSLGGAITYARRYGWAAVLGIANDEDDDGAAASAPGTGATPSSASASTVGTQADRAAVTAQTPSEPPAAPSFEAPVQTTGNASGLKWKYGTHAGLTIAETPLDFVISYAAEKTGFMADKCKEFLAENGGVLTDAPLDDIPFDRTIDGLGG